MSHSFPTRRSSDLSLEQLVCTQQGKDGDDVPRYLEKQLLKLLITLEGLREDE